MQVRSHQRVRRQGEFVIDLRRADAFKLFTAAGERLWVPGWDPNLLGALPQHDGLVFLTVNGSDQTIWTVLSSNIDAGHVRYSRVTPGVSAGIVEVAATSEGEGTRVRVSYDLTALTPEDEEALEPYSEENFAAMMKRWKELIDGMPAKSVATLATLVS